MESNELNLEEIKAKALSQFRTGKSLYGKDGAFAPLLKQFLEAALEEELNSHLDESQRKEGNRKNGRTSKTLKTDAGELEIETSRDRNGSFEPTLIKKRETILADSLQDKIIGLYGLGMSYRDIAKHIEEMYDMEISLISFSSVFI